MPYTDPQKRRDKQKAYRQTPAGKRAAQRSRDRFIAKRRSKHIDAPLIVDPAPLAQALNHWRS